MAAGSSAAARALDPPQVEPGWRGCAFGLLIEGDAALPGVPAAAWRDAERRTWLELVSAEELERTWHPSRAVTLHERRGHDDRLQITIDFDEELGYRIWAPRFGRHLISPDGTWIRSALPRLASWRAQRLLFAQALPLAATLQGLALFHSSAVALHGRAIAFTASAGTGKSSVAAHLVARGAMLLTDDVLALEPYGDQVRAWPGGGMAGVHLNEWRSLSDASQRRLGPVIGRSDKLLVSVALAPRPLPLGAVYFLRRSYALGTLRIDEHTSAGAEKLLSSGFITYLDRPEHLLTHLEACALVDRFASTFDVEIPLEFPASEVAAAIEEHTLTLWR